MNLGSTILLCVAAVCAAAGQLLFKLGASNNHHWLDYVNVHILSGLVLYGAGTLIWIYALSTQMLVTVYAFTALTFVLVYLAGVFLLGESMSIAAGAGVAMVLGGLYLITVHGS